MCKFVPDYVGEVRVELLVAVSLGDAWGISRIRRRAVCVGFLVLSLMTGPNVSEYRPDYLFQTVIGVWEVILLVRVKLKTYRTDHR